MADDIYLIEDSVLPSPLQHQRFLVIESLLQRLNALPQNVVVILTDIVTPTALMAFADHFSLIGDGWEFAKGEAEQRELIKGAIEIHRHKGTPWAIKRTLQLLGYGDSELQERFGYYEHDGTINHDSNHRYGADGHWTHYRLLMQQRISRIEAERIRALLTDVAPLRCKLASINLNNIYHNSVINHDGTHLYDEVIAQW
ncbi:Phage tail protein [Enhydrobacter sp. 8BJ]|nr:phage tail protein [Enhydrobacter sp. 8BJ]VXB84304.1 Phage tail protein [Enhydrobacter sp. 8BJ]